jgi:hypothetical protein
MPEDLVKEIEEMNSLGSVEPEVIEESIEPTEPTEPVEPTEPTEPEVIEEPTEPVEPTEPTEPALEEEDDIEKIKKENEELRRKLAESYEKKEPAAPTEPSPKEKPSTEDTFEEIDFVGDDEIDLRDLEEKSTINKLLNKVYRAGYDSVRKIQEKTLTSIPEIVKTNVTLQTTLKKKVDEFYEENKDLKPFKKAVGTVFEGIAAEHPDWTMDDVFKETGNATRKALELHEKVDNSPPSSPTNKEPRFPKSGGGRVNNQQSKINPLLEEIDQMNKVL